MASGSSSSSESSLSGSSMSALSFSSSHFPATSSSPFALPSSSSPFGSSGVSASIAMSSTSGSPSSVSHATVSSNLFSSAPSSSSSCDSPLSTVLSVQNSAAGLTTIAVSSSGSAQSSSASNSSSSPASNLVVKSSSPPPLTSSLISAAIASFGTPNSFAVSTLSAVKLTATSPLFSTVIATSASAPSAVASSCLVSSTFGVDSSSSATASSGEASTAAVSGSGSSFTGSSLAATTSAPGSTWQAQSTTTTAPLSSLGFASPFFVTLSGFCFQNSSSSFTTPSVSQFSSASTSAFSLGTSSASTSSFSFGTSSSAPFQSAFSFKNVAPPTSNIFAAKSTSSSPLFSTITANASTPTAVASGTAASTISSPAFGVSSFAPATTASTNYFSRTTSSYTGFGGGNRSAAFGGFNSFTEFSTKISAPASTSQTQSTTAPLLCPPSRGSFLPVQTTKNKKRKWKHKTPNGEAPGVKYCAENVESSPQQEVPSKSSRLAAEASRKTTPQLTPANGNSGKMEEENYSKGLALQEIPSDLGKRTALQRTEVKQSEKENIEGKSPSDAISKAFKDCATVMSSLADLNAHIKDLSGCKVKYFALESEMEAAAIAWKDKEEFLVQVHRNLYDEIKALQFSNQSLKFSNKELAGKCKQKDSEINGLKEKIKSMSENFAGKRSSFPYQSKKRSSEV